MNAEPQSTPLVAEPLPSMPPAPLPKRPTKYGLMWVPHDGTSCAGKWIGPIGFDNEAAAHKSGQKERAYVVFVLPGESHAE